MSAAADICQVSSLEGLHTNVIGGHYGKRETSKGERLGNIFRTYLDTVLRCEVGGAIAERRTSLPSRPREDAPERLGFKSWERGQFVGSLARATPSL